MITKHEAYDLFVETAEVVEEIYSLPLIIDEDEKSEYYDKPIGYHCPHCNEPIYFEDHEAYYRQSPSNVAFCPICEEDLEVD
jgi:hypothetical protein